MIPDRLAVGNLRIRRWQKAAEGHGEDRPRDRKRRALHSPRSVLSQPTSAKREGALLL
jgi:hypothetical protein